MGPVWHFVLFVATALSEYKKQCASPNRMGTRCTTYDYTVNCYCTYLPAFFEFSGEVYYLLIYLNDTSDLLLKDLVSGVTLQHFQKIL